VFKGETADPFWDESARAMLRGLILYVLTPPEFTLPERNLITIRNLVSRGEWRIQKAMQEKGGEVPPPHQLLWRAMESNPAFNGIVAGVGTRFLSMMTASSKRSKAFFKQSPITRIFSKALVCAAFWRGPISSFPNSRRDRRA
jgi:hypothetical protein